MHFNFQLKSEQNLLGPLSDNLLHANRKIDLLLNNWKEERGFKRGLYFLQLSRVKISTAFLIGPHPVLAYIQTYVKDLINEKSNRVNGDELTCLCIILHSKYNV